MDRLAIIQLGSCGGCQLSLLDLGKDFLDIMEMYSIEHFPMIREGEEFPESDLVLVEGTVRHARHLESLRKVRGRARTLVALGTCAVFGGVQGLANVSGGGRWEESISRARAGESVPLFTRRVLPLDAYVPVDVRLPGCPVPAGLLASFLKGSAEGARPTRESATVCAECPLRGGGEKGGPFRFTERKAESGICFLEQGFLCMGPLTRDGCGALCPGSSGYPCRGCRGPSDGALIFQELDPMVESIRRLSRTASNKDEQVAGYFMDRAHAFFMFCAAEPTFRDRRVGGTSGIVYRLGGE
ncbi:MAG: hypothetical protein WHT46_00240 [Candidatus Geothermincolales bacterium]